MIVVGLRRADHEGAAARVRRRDEPADPAADGRLGRLIEVERTSTTSASRSTTSRRRRSSTGEMLGLQRNTKLDARGLDRVRDQQRHACAVMTPHTHDYEFAPLPPATIALARPRRRGGEGASSRPPASTFEARCGTRASATAPASAIPPATAILLHRRYAPYDAAASRRTRGLRGAAAPGHDRGALALHGPRAASTRSRFASADMPRRRTPGRCSTSTSPATPR